MAPAPDPATALLRDATTPHGILASTVDRANYQRIWARDGILCGLAGLLAEDELLADGLRATLGTLAAAQGPDGQIPSNVAPEEGTVSFGGLAGRVDPSAWFVVGCCAYARQTGDAAFAEAQRPAMERALRVLTTWEFNRRGLVYVPQGGDWADEYVLHGYVLYVQLVRLWALRAFAATFNAGPQKKQARSLAPLLHSTFWPTSTVNADTAYHPQAYRQLIEHHGAPVFFLAALAPGGYTRSFDAWSNALAVLLGLPSDAQRELLLTYGRARAAERPHHFVPSFWPPIRSGDDRWRALRTAWRDRFSNAPGHYHNGGLWPVVNGWWGLALLAGGHRDAATDLAESLHTANAVGNFPEYLDAHEGRPQGTCPCTWSAAGALLLDCALDGQTLPFLAAPLPQQPNSPTV